MYEFPKIETIEDVLPAIKDSKEFIVVEKDGYKVVNYMVNMPETFPEVKTVNDAIRRECRGIKFNTEGKIIARPYHKFFNVNEREETLMDKVSFDVDHVILEKLDGSMVHPFYVNGHLRWATKMGITDTSMEAEVFVAKNPVYTEFAKERIAYGDTPIFEWLSRQNKIVINHKEDNLVLTGVRDMVTGKYMGHTTMATLAMGWNIPFVGLMNKSIDEIKLIEDTEGIVIRFYDGQMLKVKSDWYVLRHKSKDAIMREKNVIEYILKDEVDDVIPYLLAEDADKLRDFNSKFTSALFEYSESLNKEIDVRWANANKDRKTFALEQMKFFGKERGIAFKVLDGQECFGLVKKFVLSNLTDLDNVRYMFKQLKWEY